MKTGIKLILFAGILFFISCETNNPSYYNLKGKWVESVQRKDTLSFFYTDSVGGSFWLSNGLELRNGYMLPKAGAGSYDFKFRHEPIIKGESGDNLRRDLKEMLRSMVKASEGAVKDLANEAIEKSLKEGKGTISAGAIMQSLPAPKKLP